MILAVGARIDSVKDEGWGGYPFSELAMKHNASTEEDTDKAEVAYARFPRSTPGEFREEWLSYARAGVARLRPETGAVFGGQLLELETEHLFERRDRMRPNLVDASPAGRARARSS